MKILTVVGARPQFIKAAPVSREIRKIGTEILVHTGQHYDDNLSDVFFTELNLPEPDYHLGVGSGFHGEQTGEMLSKIERRIIDENPDVVLVYGDTNSTLAGALAAAKLNITIAHVEAGLRSYNKRMPEEVNRILTDHVSDILFCPSENSVRNLKGEGIKEGVFNVGDVMVDSLLYAAEKASGSSTILERMGLAEDAFYLATVHRAENTDSRSRLKNILEAFIELDAPIIFPIHPRTRKAIDKFQLEQFLHDTNIMLIEPLGYLDMVHVEQTAKMILTDSGGIQKEAYWLETPCVTLRKETEWVETVDLGWNKLAGADKAKILDIIRTFTKPDKHPPLYGDGKAGERIARILHNEIEKITK
jgi:UDP-N-acetylglucosamine 2-epimerase